MTFALMRIKSCMCEARVLPSLNFLYIMDAIPMCTLLFDVTIKSSLLFLLHTLFLSSYQGPKKWTVTHSSGLGPSEAVPFLRSGMIPPRIMENEGELHAAEQRAVVEALRTLERTVVIIIIDPSMVPTN